MSLERHLVGHLQHMYVTERDYQMFLCDMAGKITDQKLKSTINAEVSEMRTELEDVKKCLDLFGQPLNEDNVSPLVAAFRQDAQMCAMDMPDATAVDIDTHIAMMDVGFGHWEVGTYQGMLAMARALNRQDVAKILEHLLKHEEDDLQKVTSLLTELVNLSRQQKAA